MDQESVEVLEFYLDKFDTVYIAPIVLLEFTMVLLCIFILRYYILYRIEKNKLKKKDANYLKNIQLYIGGHCLLELLCAFFITFCIVKLTHANIYNHIINVAVAPIAGTLLAIYADNKILIPLEAATGFSNIFNKISNKKANTSDNKDSNNITININGSENNNIHKPSMKIPNINPFNNSDNLPEDLADADNFNSEIIKAINDIKRENNNQNQIILEIKEKQENQSIKINDNSKLLENTIDSLNILKQSEMINKKIELKKLIYNCLSKGFATPEENDKITLYYQSYVNLGGNHEIESLYESHYLKLEIHEERRKSQNNQQTSETTTHDKNVNLDRRNPKIYNYGQFDSEFIENKSNH